MPTLTNLQTLDATRHPGHGNRAHRRLLSLFQQVPRSSQFEAIPAFRPAWLALIQTKPAQAEALAYRLAKLSNRPLGMYSPPSHMTCNNWQYEPDCLKRAQRPISRPLA